MFGKTKVNNPIYYPLLASEEINGGNQSSTERSVVWSRFDTLASEQKHILTTEEIAEKLVDLQKSFRADAAGIEGVSVLIRWFVLGEIDQARFMEGLQSIFGEQAQQVWQFIQKEILTIKPKIEVVVPETTAIKPQSVVLRMPLLQALSQYEQLGNQLISRERIKIKSQSEPVRPSLLYWIKYYRDELGVGHHDSVQRGNFLFRSENGKRLSAEERERVNLVLKSVEENFPLEIDTERSEIIFPAFQAPTPQSQLRPAQIVPQVFPTPPERVSAPQVSQAFSFGRNAMTPSVPAAATPQGGEMSFSSKHVFPAEKTAQTPQAAPVSPSQAVPQRMNQPTTVNAPASAQTVPRANPFRIRPVSLGEEK